MQSPSGETLYWLALNLLPGSLMRMRTLHRNLGQLSALEAALPGDLADESAGTALDPCSSTAENIPPKGGWWAAASSGCIPFESPGISVDCKISGIELIQAALNEYEQCSHLGIRIITFLHPEYPDLLKNTSAPPPVLYASGDCSLLSHARYPSREQPWPVDHQPRRDHPTGTSLPGWWEGTQNSAGAPDTPATFSVAEPSLEPVRLGVVGARDASDYGRLVARRLGRALAEAGAVVVSGLALGIDAEAHSGALEMTGRTIAVLGGGFSINSDSRERFSIPCPARNLAIARAIAKRGLLLTEFPIGTVPLKQHFPRRNRIIAGLTHALAIVEAASRSGALITARLALEEGREVFAVPGRITSPVSEGTNALIRAGAATPLLHETGLIEDLPDYLRERLSLIKEQLARPSGESSQLRGNGQDHDRESGATLQLELTPAERALLGVIQPDTPHAADELSALACLPTSETLAGLVGLEIRGLICSIAGGLYLRAP